MDIFAKQSGSLYVTAFAGRLLLAMTQGIARAPDRIKRAFAEEDAEGMWDPLRWWWCSGTRITCPRRRPSSSRATLQEFGVSSIASNLNFFRERLLPFVKTAHQAQSDAQLAASGVYFIAAVDQIGLSLLQTAMKAGPVRGLQQKILSRLPLPDDLKASYYQALGTQPKATTVPSAAPPSPSRAERFDRADFTPRPARSPAAGQLTQGARSDTSAAASSRPPTPILAKSDVTRAYLFTLGWEGAEVDRFLAGPGAKKRT